MKALFTSKFVSFIVTFFLAIIIISPITISYVQESNANFAQHEDEETFGDNNIPMSSSFSNRYSMLVNYSDVLIIRNLNSFTSMTIADYFRSQRNISWAHVCNVTTATTEVIDSTTFNDLANQVKSCINTLPPATAINYLVTTKGVPLKTSRSPWEYSSSVDSELALVGGPYEAQIGQLRWIMNPYFNDTVQFSRNSYGFYIVTRLTAFTEAEAIGLIDKATEAIGRKGRFVFDVDPGRDGSPGYKVGNDWMRVAANILTARGFDVVLDQTSTFLTNYSNVAGYTSWGSNDGSWYTAINVNSGFENDADTNGIPDGWFYDDTSGNANITMNSTIVSGGSWSLRIERPIADNNYTAISQNVSIIPDRRYFLAGNVNLSYGVTGKGLLLQVQVFDSMDNLLSIINATARSGTTNWTGLNQVIYEPIQNAATLRVSIIFAEGNGTAFVDSVRLFEIRPHNQWVLGSLAETYVSTGGRSFTYGTYYGQSQIADLIKDGVTGVKGYVYEPYLTAVAHPNILFDRYTKGYTLGESYMMASEISLSWMDAIIGDPKLSPYNFSYIQNLVVTPNDLRFSNPYPQPGETIDFNVTVRNTGHFPANNATMSFYLGDPRLGGTLLANHTTSILDGSEENITVQWTASMVSDWYDLCVFADSPDEFFETDESDNIACGQVGVVSTYTLPLTPGHRFISFPLYPANDSVSSVLSSIAGCYDYVRWYSSIDVYSPWKSFVPGRTFNSLERLDNRKGFWINMTSTCNLTVTGVKGSFTWIQLFVGWNMVGFPSFNTTYAIANLKADLGLGGVIVETFDAGAAPYYLQRVSDTYVMRTGEGYWIFVPSNTIWII